MSAEEIFESEKRNGDDLYDIHFHMEGSFWRAYEWSAYLARNFPSGLDDSQRLKAIRKSAKGNEGGYVQVGLQLSSFDKYFPNVTDDSGVFEMADKHIIIHSRRFFEDADFSDYSSVLDKWKADIRVGGKKRRTKGGDGIETTESVSMESLIREITAYPMESKTLIESMQFLAHIRDAAAKITKGMR